MVTRSRNTVWENHAKDGVTYSLKHLHPTYLVLKAVARGNRPARNISVRVEYSHHCFSRATSAAEGVSTEDLYLWAARPNDPRVFCALRWKASMMLPDLVRCLDTRRCHLTRRANYFAVKRNGASGHYVIYFRVDRRFTGGADVRLFVESAYHRDDMELTIQNAERTSILDILLSV